MDIILKRETTTKSSYNKIVNAAKLTSMVLATVNVALAQTNHTAYMLAAANASVVPTQVQSLLANVQQLFPGIVVVAFIGFIGVIFRGRTDRGISREQGNIKIFESIIKDNDALRTKNDKLMADINQKYQENTSLTVKNTNLENHSNTQAAELIRLKEDNSVAQKIIADKEKQIARLKDGRLQDKLKEMGVTKEQLAELLERGEEVL